MNTWRFLRKLLPVAILMSVVACSGTDRSEKSKQSLVPEISGIQSFQALIDSSGNRLLLFDLYADWCMPCRILSPVLEKIAVEQKDRVRVYKINVDKDPDIARSFGLGTWSLMAGGWSFGVAGIPFVVLVKNKKGIRAFTGVQPEGEYVRAILEYGEVEKSADRDEPDGELVNGVRIIKISTATSPGDLYVYRGEEVKIIVQKVDIPYSVHIPAFKISKTAVVGQDLEIEFKAAETGVFPFFCNGKCPSGDGQRFARIVVLEYETNPVKAVFKSINAKKAIEYIGAEKPFILDVRTPNEFYEGHVPGATLIPVQQLADRVNEIEDHKNSPVFVYCRSGNRSIVAAQILIRNGFKKVYNLKGGIREWQKAGGAVVR